MENFNNFIKQLKNYPYQYNRLKIARSWGQARVIAKTGYDAEC